MLPTAFLVRPDWTPSMWSIARPHVLDGADRGQGTMSRTRPGGRCRSVDR